MPPAPHMSPTVRWKAAKPDPGPPDTAGCPPRGSPAPAARQHGGRSGATRTASWPTGTGARSGGSTCLPSLWAGHARWPHCGRRPHRPARSSRGPRGWRQSVKRQARFRWSSPGWRQCAGSRRCRSRRAVLAVRARAMDHTPRSAAGDGHVPVSPRMIGSGFFAADGFHPARISCAGGRTRQTGRPGS